MRRQALEEELQRQGPPAKPAIDRAKALLNEFPRFWEIETQPAERRKLLLSLFEQIWAQNGQIVAVQPHDDFLPYFQATQQFLQHHPAQGGAESGSDGGCARTLPPDPEEIEVLSSPPPERSQQPRALERCTAEAHAPRDRYLIGVVVTLYNHLRQMSRTQHRLCCLGDRDDAAAYQAP
jgi:hypothetical protein